MNSVLTFWVCKQAAINPFSWERLREVGFVLFSTIAFVKSDQFAVMCYLSFQKFMVCG